jgi:hypothetical protein
METNEQDNRPAAGADSNTEANKKPGKNTNAMVGGHVAPSEEGEVSEERIAKQARRAEQPEPDAKNAKKKDNPSNSASSEIINNTGDDADTPEADAATG